MNTILSAHAVSMTIGKATLLRVLSGDLRPTRGGVVLGQRDIGAYSPRELALRRAMLSQHVHVAFPFTVEEIVEMGTGRSRAATRALVEEAA